VFPFKQRPIVALKPPFFTELSTLFGLWFDIKLSRHLHYGSDVFHPDLAEAGVQAHTYLRSVHNISVERTWLRLRLEFGDTAVLNFNQGVADGRYNSEDPYQ